MSPVGLTTQQIYQLIEARPGITASEIAAQMCGKPNSARFWAKLPTLETEGYLVYIEGNQVFPFKNINTEQN